MSGRGIAIFLVIMLILGLLIGGGVALYFHFRDESSGCTGATCNTGGNDTDTNNTGATGPSEVYLISGNYTAGYNYVPTTVAQKAIAAANPYYQTGFAYTDAVSQCQLNGAVVATQDQLTAAQGQGANWCSYGWLADGVTVGYPLNEEGFNSGCGETAQVYTQAGGSNAYGVNCYGPKPASTSAAATNQINPIIPFNGSSWSSSGN